MLKLDTLRKNPSYDSIYIVSIADVFGTQTDGILPVNLPGLPTMNALISGLEMDSSGNLDSFIWTGNFYDYYTDSNNQQAAYFDGMRHLAKEGDDLYGYIKPLDNENVYELATMDGHTLLMKYSAAAIGREQEVCAEPLGDEEEIEMVTSPGCDKTIRVLVLYTTGSIWTMVHATQKSKLMMQLLNGAAYNSVSPYNGSKGEVKFELAGIVSLSTFSEVPSIMYTTANLATHSWAQYYRDIYFADLVVCLTGTKYQNNLVGWAGTDFTVSPTNAYVVLDAAEANVNFNFAHEIGHLMTARHQQSSIDPWHYYDDAPGKAHGYKFLRWQLFNSKTYRDIMATGPNHQHMFSNPDFEIHGHDMGTASDNNVTETMLENACTIAQYRTSDAPPPFYSGIGLNKTWYNTSETVTATPYTYNAYGTTVHEWKLSSDGGNTWTSLGQTTGSSPVYFNMPSTPSAIVAKTSWDGVAIYHTHTKHRVVYNKVGVATAGNSNNYPIGNKPSGEGEDAGNTMQELADNTARNMKMNLLPNPAKDEVVVELGMNEAGRLSITDAMGRLVYEVEIAKAAAMIKIDTKVYSAGTYFVKFTSGKNILVQKLMVTK